ncbi:poliovirus receptor-like [Scleropages formosus]|uniref:Si:ch73-22o12.1 n=1 Tax=Scleropages formosus TaxID=113540 RepID=A0A8C9RWT7_SCLFO|nr:poliovirus receptor-like [Scleropages formosus]
MGRNCARNAATSQTLFQVLLLFSALLGALGQRVKVDQEVVSYPGQTVNLRCQFAGDKGTELTQVSWIWEPTEGKRENIAVFHPSYGASYPTSPLKGRVSFINPSLDNPSISIANVKMTDEGRYICEYATYPTGNEQGTTSLVMLAKPKNFASAVTVAAGDKPVVVAQCNSTNGRPAAQISWTADVNGNGTQVTSPGTDNTVTVVGQYWLAPTPADNGKDISCIVNHRTQDYPEIFNFKLSVEYPPVLTIVGYDDNWYMGRSYAKLTCRADGNPSPPSVKWKTLSGPMPETVQVKDNVLIVQKVDEKVNVTFVCEATNHLGVGSHQLIPVVREAQSGPSNAGVVAGAIIGVLLALLLVGVLIGVLVSRNRRQQQGYRGNANQGTYDIKTRIFGSKKTSKNGTGGNNNGPIYTYRESDSETLTEKSNHINRNDGIITTTPTAHDILLSGEMDEAERRKFDELEDGEEDDRYVHFNTTPPVLQIRPHDEEMGGYLDDGMESQRDGSVISRTAVYV